MRGRTGRNPPAESGSARGRLTGSGSARGLAVPAGSAQSLAKCGSQPIREGGIPPSDEERSRSDPADLLDRPVEKRRSVHSFEVDKGYKKTPNPSFSGAKGPPSSPSPVPEIANSHETTRIRGHCSKGIPISAEGGEDPVILGFSRILQRFHEPPGSLSG